MPKDVNNQVIVEVVKDNSIAILKCLPYELADGFQINEEIVKIAINQKGVKNEVNWPAIKKAINNVIDSRTPIFNLIISKSSLVPQNIFHVRINKYYSFETLKKLLVVWHQLGKILNGMYKNERLLPAYFYLKNEIIFEISSSRTIDVYGNIIIQSKQDETVRSNDTVTCEALSDRLIYRSKINGYLIADEKGCLGIQDPLQTDECNTRLSLIHYPITTGLTEFDLFLDEIKNKYRLQSMPEFKTFTKPNVNVFTLKEGVTPIEGKNAEINWCFKIDENLEKNVLQLNENVPFKKINSETLIAVKKPCLPGRNGVDVFGELIPVLIGDDFCIRTDTNIIEKEIDGCTHYSAAIDGVFFKINKSISIENAMFINSNIDASSGSINHQGSLVIIGDIKAGITITCKNKLFIKGSVENNCKIICDGDISIMYGVIGTNTLVQASGFCEVGFVTDAKIISNDDLVIYKYSYNANLFSRGTIEIKGISIRNHKCALIGGVVNSLIKIIVHSIGSEEIITNIILGKDLNLEEKILKLKQSLPSFDINLLNLNKRANILTKPNGENSQNTISSEIKLELKKIFLEIKWIQENKTKINFAISRYQQLLFIDNPLNVKMLVLNYLIPDVYIKIMNHAHKVTQAFHSDLKIVLKNGDVCVVNS